MGSLLFTQKLILSVSTVLLCILECKSDPVFTCPTNKGDPLPPLPRTYTTNIRINYINKELSVEARQVVNQDENRMAIEFWHPNKRHIKYIKDDKVVLVIMYNTDSSPNCTVKRAFSLLDIFEMEDSEVGEYLTLKRIMEGLMDGDNIHKFAPSDALVANGVFLKKWEACLQYPPVNISLSFTDQNWKQTFKSSLLDKERYLVQLEAEAYKAYVTALFSNFNPVMPDDAEFQPPERVHCEGYRSNRAPPSMPNYFSYDSEIIVYESSYGIAPVVSQRKVYYDFPAGISRTDFYDPLAEDQDLFSPVRAQGVSIIHDFNSGIQYRIDPLTGQCQIDNFKATIGPVLIQETGNQAMRRGDEFFSLKGAKISYNGEFPTRGYMADVYTARIKDLKGDGYTIYSWYFATNRTQVVVNENVETNMLLRMVIHPEANDGKEGEVDVNFYNFVREEPNAFNFDLTSCYNDSYSKTFVLTFPVINELVGYEKVLKDYIHQALITTAGVSKQRIFLREVVSSGKYLFAEFKLLASPDIFGKTIKKLNESTLEEAVNKLKKSVAEKTFNVPVATRERVLDLRAEPDGLNELAGDRRRNQPSTSYKEGSVIALTIGMLFLGVVLGGVALNLIVSRKFGVSLCQTSKNGNPYSGSLNESSM